MKKNTLEFVIKVQQDLINRLTCLNEFSLSTQRKFLNSASDNWYLCWKVGYLIQKIKQHMPEEVLKANDGELEGFLDNYTPFKDREYK